MAGLKLVLVFAVVMVATFQLQSTTAQTMPTRHVVGGVFGWNVPSNGPATYTNWTSGQTFTVGDTLVFNFTTGFHDVAEVSQAAYGPCTIANPISAVTDGPATLTLNTSGNHYYICRVGSHCQLGQKLMINVTESGSDTPTAAGPTTNGAMPPPPPSSATSFAAVVPVTFLAAVLGLLF